MTDDAYIEQKSIVVEDLPPLVMYALRKADLVPKSVSRHDDDDDDDDEQTKMAAPADDGAQQVLFTDDDIKVMCRVLLYSFNVRWLCRNHVKMLSIKQVQTR